MPVSITQILHTARSGMLARLLDLDTVSANLANINTVGFQSSRANFQELLDAEWRSGVQLRATERLTSQGTLRLTTNPLDLAIQGEGFFAVTTTDGEVAYTRDGQFSLDSARQIVSAGGQRLVWQGQIPADALQVHVNPDGTVMALQGDAWTQVGTIGLYRLPNPSGMEGIGNNLWRETEVSGAAQAGAPGTTGYGQVIGNALEQSNVNMAAEMSHMVALQRAFEMASRTFQTTDEMLSQAIHVRRG